MCIRDRGRWDNKSPFNSVLTQQHLCKKLPKSDNVCWSYSVLHHCRFFETQCTCILLVLISSFFNLRQIISWSTGPIFTIFSPNEFSWSGTLFWFLYRYCHGNRFWAKFAKWPLFNTLAFRNRFEYRKYDWEVIKNTILATFYAISMKMCPLTPKIMQGVYVSFGTRWQK